MWNVWERRQVDAGFWLRSLNERKHSEDLGVDGRIILKCIFKNKMGCELYLAEDRDR
jgi:hypothetical protein